MVKNTRGNGEVPTSTDIYINTREKGCKYIFLLFQYIYIVSLPEFKGKGGTLRPRSSSAPAVFDNDGKKFTLFILIFLYR